jgi:ABC-type dipeptide/oligopeptide/nickel transport system ATPase component
MDMAIIARPLVVADAPTTGADVHRSTQIPRPIKDMRDRPGKSMPPITHVMAVVSDNCHKITVRRSPGCGAPCKPDNDRRRSEPNA